MARIKQLRRIFWMRLRFQAPIAILLAAIFPCGMLYNGHLSSYDVRILNNTFIGVVLAIGLGSWLMRNIARYPGSEALSSTIPSFFGSFGILLIFFVFARVPYNRTILFSGFLISIIWFFVMSAVGQRRRILNIGLIPFGDLSNIEGLPNVRVRRIHAPDEPIDDLDAIAADFRVDLPAEWDRQLANCALERIPVYHTKHLVESLTGRVAIEHLSENSFGSLTPRQDYMMFKLAVDWLAALALGVLMLPAMIVFALAIKLTSRGPALFRQERMGYEGRPFTIFKFRTMKVVEVSEDQARNMAMTRDNDIRITTLGRFMRKTRIDELPQIINVLRGEMSWIGPRPEAMVLSRWYEEQIPFYRYRHIVRPGIAGWAQVCQGHVSEVDEVQSKLYYDFYYIKHYSLWIDLLIVVRTIWIVISGHGAR